jgi:sarcosine oxidase, subunit alpha
MPLRLPAGGRIDRTKAIGFTFDSRRLHGYAGDTLASALLASGVRVIGRSFKYHRPRGVFAAGAEEPNALVELVEGGDRESNFRATLVPLREGLVANSINRWPSLRFDIAAVNDFASGLLPAGFYYKTFMWPRWSLFEGAIRRIAGLGRAPDRPDSGRYRHIHAACDVLVIGSGPAGLAAARAAGETGAAVMLVEMDTEPGGSLLWQSGAVFGAPGELIRADHLAALATMPNVEIHCRTAALGYYDHNLVTAVTQNAAGQGPGQLLRLIRARSVVLAAGAFERPLLFPDNDRPGIMLASAVRHYLNRYAVAAGRQAVLYTDNDSAYQTGFDLAEAGVAVAAIVDRRARPPEDLLERARTLGIRAMPGSAITRTSGRRGLTDVTTAPLKDGRFGTEIRIAADFIGTSGGWTPTVHLFSQSGGTLRYAADAQCFVPDRSPQSVHVAGAANGTASVAACLRDGAERGRAVALGGAPVLRRVPQPEAAPRLPAPDPPPRSRRKQFVDLQNDVTAGDIAMAARENYASVEHLKRYTTTGMGTDQGKTSNVNALALLAAATARPVEEVGTTRFRPPFVPVTLGAVAGPRRGDLFRPRRYLPAHDWHAGQGAVFEEYGGWERPACYPGRSEAPEDATRREALAVRQSVGLFDGSPLGKIEIHGPDAATLLDRVYVGTASTLKPGRVRYGLMLNENGTIIDDGVFARLADDRFLVFTTSGGATRIAAMLEEWLQCEWTDLRVFVTPVTGHWAIATLSGPKARDVMRRVGTDLDFSPDAFPHMSMREGAVAGIPARVMRVSFTGETSYEINVSARHAEHLFEALRAGGADCGITPYGIEALQILRTEKGYLHIGTDTDGTTIPEDVGLGAAIARKPSDFIGRRSLQRPAALAPDRLQLVGLRHGDPSVVLPVGAHVVTGPPPAASEGFVTSTCYSPALRRGIALALVKAGRKRQGETVGLYADGRFFQAEIVSPVFLDPAGERLVG